MLSVLAILTRWRNSGYNASYGQWQVQVGPSESWCERVQRMRSHPVDAHTPANVL